MPKICHYSSGLRPIIGGTPMPRMPTPRAFTLMEMTVSIGILLIVMLSVGVIFQSAGRTVGVSQASMEMLSNVRAIQQQIANDVGGISKDCFLVIRSGTFTDGADPTNPTHRCDLISFISYGSFPHRTGTTGVQPFTDNNTIAPAAFITWGQLALEKIGAVNSDYLASNQNFKLPLNQVPTGIETVPAGLIDGALTLGRTAILLSPKSTGTNNNNPGGDSVAAYQNQISPPVCAIDYNTAAVGANNTTDSNFADITQSRIDLAATTPTQIMSYMLQSFALVHTRDPRFEADHFCYRHAALRSPYDSEQTGAEPLINGYFRMQPIALQGVTSLAIEWTDGAVFQSGDHDPITGNTVNSGDTLIGTTKWYGLGAAKNGSTTPNVVDPVGTVVNPGDGRDSYCAIFSFDTPRSSWPVALRFRYHISDPTNRLQNGRDFVQVVRLPN